MQIYIYIYIYNNPKKNQNKGKQETSLHTSNSAEKNWLADQQCREEKKKKRIHGYTIQEGTKNTRVKHLVA